MKWAVDARLVESDAPTADHHYAADPVSLRRLVLLPVWRA
jgi:hypothetical protein